MVKMKQIVICLILLKILSSELVPYQIGSNFCFNRNDFIIVRNELKNIELYKSNLKDYSNKVYILSNENVYLKNNIQPVENKVIKKIKFITVISLIIGSFIGGIRIGIWW